MGSPTHFFKLILLVNKTKSNNYANKINNRMF